MTVTEEFVTAIWNGTVNAVTDGAKAVVIWGFNNECLSLIDRMKDRGMDNLISGIVDPRKEVQGVQVGHLRVQAPEFISSLKVDTFVIAVDKEKELALTDYSRIDSRTPRVIMAGTQHLQYDDPVFSEILLSCRVPSRAAGYKNMLVHIYQSILYLAQRGLKGSFAEFGVYKGGTTVFIAKTLQRLNIDSKIYALDTFSGFPTRKSFLDLYSDTRDEFFDFETVSAYCGEYPIELVRGDISETYRCLEGIPLVFSFFDTDNYSGAKAALQMCYEQTVTGGILAFDHLYCDERWLYTLGERIAANEVLRDKSVFNLYGTGIFIKL